MVHKHYQKKKAVNYLEGLREQEHSSIKQILTSDTEPHTLSKTHYYKYPYDQEKDRDLSSIYPGNESHELDTTKETGFSPQDHPDSTNANYIPNNNSTLT